MARLSINLLGSFQVQRDGMLVTRFSGNKVRALLAYLAVEGDQPLARSVLAGLLWPEQSDNQALRNLSQALLRLSEALGDPPLHVSRQAIQWQPESAEVDVRVFERLARSGETADLA
jgi:DNA-binding SARP family transcriptional activator